MAIAKLERRLRVGVLGCGPIAQFAHFESCQKARNAELHAICDVAGDLVERMAGFYRPSKTYLDYDEMLADPEVDAVIIATSDSFHVDGVETSARGRQACAVREAYRRVGRGGRRARGRGEGVRQDPAGRPHEALRSGSRSGSRFRARRDGRSAGAEGLVLRFHPSLHDDGCRAAAARAERRREEAARKSQGRPRRYFMLAHGSHLVDTARFLVGDLVEVSARLTEKFGAYCWFVDVAFANGAVGHLDLTVAVRMDWHEGLQLYGENGSVIAKTFNPWYYKASEVDIFSEKDAAWRRPLGADGHFYRRQLEGFADTILDGAPMRGADIADGVASVRAMAAIAQSVRSGRPVRLVDAQGPV